MKTKMLALFLVIAAIPTLGIAQGTFQNLDFELAVIVPVPGDPQRIQFAPAFPGWTGGSFAIYNDLYIGSSGFGLLGPGSPVSGRIAGNYTAVLQAGQLGFQPDVSLIQSGTIPSGTASLRFLAGQDFRGGAVAAINGQPLNLITLQSFGGYAELGADISQYAGQTVELRFTRPAVPGGSHLYLDNISFSTVGVPEPGTWALLGLGGALLWCGARRRG